jgi:hypothetical protein
MGRILEQQASPHGLLHRRFHHDMRLTDRPSEQASFAYLVVHALKIGSSAV